MRVANCLGTKPDAEHQLAPGGAGLTAYHKLKLE